MAVTRSSIYHKPRVVSNTLGTLLGGSGLILGQGSYHAHLRRIVAPALHHSSLLSLEPVFLRHAAELANRLATSVKSSIPIDILDASHISTFGAIVDACFGDHVIPQPSLDKLRSDFFESMREPPSHMVRRFLLQHFFNFVSPNWFGWREELKYLIKQHLASFVASFKTKWLANDLANPKNDDHNEGKNLLRLITKASANNLLSQEETVALVMTFLVAGQVTTSFSVAWTLYRLATHPKWQAQLRDELATWEPENGLETLDELPLLGRIVKESLRLDPPVNYISRVVMEDDVLDGYAIPKGSAVRVPILAIQRDTAIWGEDANEFNPDRWLREDVQNKTKFFCIFWFGFRGCIGQRFAIYEMKAFVAHIVKRLTISVNERDELPTASGPFSTPRNMKLYFHEIET